MKNIFILFLLFVNCWNLQVVQAQDLVANNDTVTVGIGSYLQFNALTNDEGNNVEIIDVIAPIFGNLIWHPNGNMTYETSSETTFPTYVTIPYQVTDENGEVAEAVIILQILSEQATALTVRTRIDCENAWITNKYEVIVSISGGQAPYQIFAGAFSSELDTTGVVSFQVSMNHGYSVIVVDSNNSVREVNEEIGCISRL